MAQSIQPISLILNMNDRLFINSLAGVTEQHANERISGHNNPIIWIAAHTVSSRYLMLFVLGKPAADPYQDLFADFRAYDAALNYPTIDEVKAQWETVTALLHDALQTVSEEYLAAETQVKTPIGDYTNGGTIAFMAQHESYDIGQVAFLKKYNTKEAIKY